MWPVRRGASCRIRGHPVQFSFATLDPAYSDRAASGDDDCNGEKTKPRQAVVRRGGCPHGAVARQGVTDVATIEDVACYVALAVQACGTAWLSPRRLRFGALSLLPVLLVVLDGAPTSDRRGPTR